MAEQVLSNKLRAQFASPGPSSHWCGYYNYSPMSADGAILLAHKVDFDGRDIKADDVAEIGYYTMADRVWHKLAMTRAINWQQGAMVQWLGPDFNTRCIFNDVQDGHFVSRIYDVRKRQLIKTVPFAVYGVSPNGKMSVTLQFERSYWCRAYHYESVRNVAWDGLVAEDDGIFSVDLETDQVKRILSIRDIIKMTGWTAKPTEKQWIEHIMLNPSGTRFAFYYRCGDSGSFSKTVGFTAKTDGSDCRMMPLDPSADPSHLGWIDDSRFVVYCYVKTEIVKRYESQVKSKKAFSRLVVGFVRKIIKKILPSKVVKAAKGAAYYEVVDLNANSHWNLPITQLPEDGHPSFTKDGRFMLTDTYSDSEDNRHLLLYDFKRGKSMELGRFYSPFNCCGYRADLHPRFSRDEQCVIIDSAQTGQHQIHVFDLDWSKIRK